MKQHLANLIDAVISNSESDIDSHFSAYVAEKSMNILEGKQGELFGDEEPKQKTKSRYIVLPMGIGFDDLALAKASEKNHPKDDITIIDKDNDDAVVYEVVRQGNKK